MLAYVIAAAAACRRCCRRRLAYASSLSLGGPAEARHNSTAMEAEAAPAFDFSHLPTDALHVVFEHVFAPTDPQPALPLSLFWEHWAACSAVCKTWRDVSVAVACFTVPVDAQLLPRCCRGVAMVLWAPYPAVEPSMGLSVLKQAETCAGRHTGCNHAPAACLDAGAAHAPAACVSGRFGAARSLAAVAVFAAAAHAVR